MSEKVGTQTPSSDITSALKAASKVDVSENASKILEEKFDKPFQSKLRRLQTMRFKNESDLVNRFIYPDELVEQDGVYMWREYIVLDQTQVQGILEAEWKEQPPATGRIRFNSYLKQRYIGISSPTITKFLEANEEHQLYRQRRKSQRTKTTVASLPFKQWAMDLTDVPKIGVYRYLFVIADLFSKYIYAVPLSRKTGEVIARELEKIFQSLPAGARPGSIRCDRGTEFSNPEVREVLARTNTKLVQGLAGVPTGNAIEQFNRIVKTNLFSEMGTDKRIGTFGPALKKTVKAYNTTQSRATTYPPAVLHNPALPPNIIADVLKKLNSNAEGGEPNKRFQPPLFRGDLVRIAVEELDSSIRLKIKDKSYKPSHEATYSKQIFTVVNQSSDNYVTVLEKKGLKFTRGGCLRIPKTTKVSADTIVEEEENDEQEAGTKRAAPPVPFVQKTRARVTGPLTSLQ
jgi:transposase InsO family protein